VSLGVGDLITGCWKFSLLLLGLCGVGSGGGAGQSTTTVLTGVAFAALVECGICFSTLMPFSNDSVAWVTAAMQITTAKNKSYYTIESDFLDGQFNVPFEHKSWLYQGQRSWVDWFLPSEGWPTTY